MRLTDAQIRCLLALLSLTRLGGAIASKDVSKVLGVSRPSVHRMLENLGNSGLTEKKPYGAVKLTEEGLRLAEELEERLSEAGFSSIRTIRKKEEIHIIAHK